MHANVIENVAGLDNPTMTQEKLFDVEPERKPRTKYAPVYKCQLVKESKQALVMAQIHCPADCEKLISDFLEGTDRENLVCLMLDSKNRVIGINLVSVGILDSSLVHPREVFKPAILCNAASIIIGHNHPSGDPTPSPEDRRVTQRIMEAAAIIGIDLLDHVIVGDGGRHASLKQLGYM